MPPEVQQAITNFLGALAVMIGAVASVWAAFYRARTLASVDHTKSQTEAVKTQATEIPTLAEKMTKIADQQSEALTMLVTEQRANDENTKRLIDRSDLLDSLVKQSIEASTKQAEALTQLTALMQSFAVQMTSSIRDMKNARIDIISTVNETIDARTGPLAAAASSIAATVTGNEKNILSLDTQLKAHTSMTDEAFKKLMDRLETLPTKDELREALQQLQTELTTKNEKIAELTAQVAERDERLKNQTSVIQDLTAKQGKIPEEKPHEQTA